MGHVKKRKCKGDTESLGNRDRNERWGSENEARRDEGKARATLRGRETRIWGLFNHAVLLLATTATNIINQPCCGSRLIADGWVIAGAGSSLLFSHLHSEKCKHGSWTRSVSSGQGSFSVQPERDRKVNFRKSDVVPELINRGKHLTTRHVGLKWNVLKACFCTVAWLEQNVKNGHNGRTRDVCGAAANTYFVFVFCKQESTSQRQNLRISKWEKQSSINQRTSCFKTR